MSSLVLQCPLCSKPFGVLPEQAGDAVQCPHCSEAVRVPADLVPPESAPPEPEQEVFGCPVCSGQFAILPEMYGQKVGCPHCESTVMIQPAASTSPQSTQAPPRPAVSETVGEQANSEEEVDERDLFAPGYKPKTENKNEEKAKPRRQSSKRRENRSTPTPTNESEPATDAPSTENEISSSVPAMPTGVSQVVEPEANSDPEPVNDTDAESEYDELAELMPPTFDVLDPQQLSFKDRNNPDRKVILPDGKGGLSRVDDRIVTIVHKGEEINLISLPPEQLRRKRQIQNVIAVIIGAIILTIVFVLLRKTG